MIPHIFHHIWVGPDPMPVELEVFRNTWQHHHPGWEMRLWTEENLPPDFRRREVYERLRVPAERSDMMRLEILHRHGGVYLDCDFECQRSIEPLLDGVEIFTAWLKAERVNNAIIGARPGHPLLDRAIDLLRPREFHGLDKRGTGSLFWNRLVQEDGGVTTFPQWMFYPPYSASTAERARAYAVHHNARSWKDGPALRSQHQRAEERLDAAIQELEAERLRLAEARAEIAELRARLAAAEREASAPEPGRSAELARRALSLFRR